MGGMSSSTKSGDEDKRNQELIEKYWILKESIEDRTVKFLSCVDILESASIHILSCNKKTKDRDLALACDPHTRKLLSMCKVLEEGERNAFVNEIVTFLEFVSQKITELQAGYVHRDVTCSTIRKFKESVIEIEDQKDSGDGLETILEDFKLQIKKLEEDNKGFKEENVRLQRIVDSLEKSNEDQVRLNQYKEKEIKRLRNDLQDYEKKNNSENENKVLELQNKLTYEKNEREKIIKDKHQVIEGLEKSVDSLKKDKELKQDEISKLKKRLKDNKTLVEDLTSEHEKDVANKDFQYETKIAKLAQEAAAMKNDIANLLKKHGEELDMFDEKSVAELKWNELKDNVNTKFQKKIELKDKLDKLKIELDTANFKILRLQGERDASEDTVMKCNEDYGLLELELKQKKLDFNQCYDEKLAIKNALDKTRNELGEYEKKLKESEKNLKQAIDELGKCAEDKKKLDTELKKSSEDKKKIQANLEQYIEMYQRCVKEKCETDSKLKQSVEEHKKCINEKQKAEKQILSLQSKHRTLEMDTGSKIKELETKLNALEKQRRNSEQILQKFISENETLSRKLNDMKKKKIHKVKLFSFRRPNTLSDFEDAVIAMLKSRIDDDVRELKFELQNNPDDVNKDIDPTIVLCFCGSRIGTDAEKAVEGLILSPKMALVMIHHKDVHALPQQLSERVITGQEFKKLDFITDMAFLRDKGIFPCEINNNSLVKLVNFIKKNGKEYNKY